MIGQHLFKISGTSHIMTWCHIPKDLTLLKYCCENFTFCMVNWISVEINWASVPYVLLCMIRLVDWSLLKSECKAVCYWNTQSKEGMLRKKLIPLEEKPLTSKYEADSIENKIVCIRASWSAKVYNN